MAEWEDSDEITLLSIVCRGLGLTQPAPAKLFCDAEGISAFEPSQIQHQEVLLRTCDFTGVKDTDSMTSKRFKLIQCSHPSICISDVAQETATLIRSVSCWRSPKSQLRHSKNVGHVYSHSIVCSSMTVDVDVDDHGGCDGSLNSIVGGIIRMMVSIRQVYGKTNHSSIPWRV